MKKNLFLVLLFVVQSAFAQIVSYDNTFASNGKYTVTASINTSYRKRIVQNTDGSIYFTYARENASLNSPECVISKLTPAGALDSSFGNNGETIISNYYAGVDSFLTKLADGKLLIYGFDSDGTVIARLLPNGQPDTSFGTNGIAKISNVYTDFNSYGYGLYLQNNKIIIYGMSSDGPGDFYKSIYRLNTDGSIDTTFGNNGSIRTMGNFVFLDSQLNIISLISDHSHPGSSTAYPNGGLEKYNSNGQPLTSFGNNGVSVFTTSPGMIGSAIMDKNNNIVCYNMNNEIFRLNSNGLHNSSFTFNSSSYPFTISSLSLVTENNNNYYIAGQTGSMGETFFISRLTQTGAVDPVFNYYSEATATSDGIGEMIINNDNIIAERGTQILKFLLSNPTLGTANNLKLTHDIAFENPIQQDLVYQTKEKVTKIEIYSADGKFVKTVKENNSAVSELSKGLYFLKVSFENGKTVHKKVLKN
ncbi:T9SS type A sorting domain-containing protein [Chryseobacterium sp. JUb7]|uniref:T9SS type A sorting domain-containing protein n=1 Tax=Chryseobacterium sp. JUb7 TaxID=2940599 RepID=UPI0021683D90|nr:T9SS type A sorting domain-containing protein [Chryseobacterium sp. JUb7]MCS3529785.1 putative delta-60 repeat protein [Chryseobacterium sp. JUb7]